MYLNNFNLIRQTNKLYQTQGLAEHAYLEAIFVTQMYSKQLI